jgi:hypothetical protein
MKAQILKIAGVKNESEFYRKFPTEEAFMKKHGKELKKADPGAAIGLTKPKQMDVNIATPTLTAIDPIVSKVGKKSFFGRINDSLNSMDTDAVKGLASGIAGGLSGIIGGFNQLNEEKKQIGNLNMWSNVGNVVAAAAGSRPQATKRRYARPEDQMVENMNPLGVSGDNFLQAANGMMIGGNPTEIQNTYAPNVMYTDLGYEPLNDSNKVKDFKKGGKLKKAKSGVAQILGGVGSAASAIPGIGTIASVALPLLGDVYDLIVPDKNAQEIKKKEEEIAMNTGFANGQNQVANTFGQYSESGSVGRNGWVSHDWQPQVITKFGDLDVSQVHAFAHDGMPEYRAGGHLKEYTPPSAEAMYTGRAEDGGQYSLGGELKTMWGGEAEPISYNPYLPGTGETVMFRGQSHDETNGNGQSGIGVKYGDGGMMDYAEYGGNEQDADVEVERNEPGTELIDPQTGEKNLVVYGNMKIDKAAAAHIGDNKAENIKYKNYIADLSKGETKANKTIEKATMLANNPNASKLEIATAEAMMKGGDLTLAKIANQKVKAAEWQNATLDLAKKHGLKSDALAEGKLKIDKDNSMLGKFGAKLETAANGKNLTNVQPALSGLLNLLYTKGYDVGNVSGKRSGKTAQGKQSRHKVGEALDVAFNKLGSKAYDALTKDSDIVNYLLDNGLTAINEYDPKVRSKTGGTAGHIHFGLDKGTPTADKFRKQFDNTKLPGKNFGDNWDNERQIWQPNNMFPTNVKPYDTSLSPDSWADDGSSYWKPILGVPQEFSNGKSRPSKPGQATGDSWNQDADGSNIWSPKLGIPTQFPNARNRTSLLGKDYDPGYDEQPFYKPRNFEYTPTYKSTETRTSTGGTPLATTPPIVKGKDVVKGNGKGKTVAPVTTTPNKYNASTALRAEGTPTGKYNWNNELMDIQAQASQASSSLVDPRSGGWDGTDNYQNRGIGATPGIADTQDSSTGGRMSWENIIRTGLSSAYPFLRQKVTNPLDPSQLAPEMLAASLNQEEPVSVQSYSPILAQPTRFSFQDQLNEITKQTRAAERMSPYNPEAQSIIAGGAYDARNKVLADQFRTNQGEQARVAEQNRAALNEAQRFNIGQYDQQMVRTSQAKSNTKQQKIEIAKSIADKIQQNKLETRQANLMQNMYPGFNFTQSGVAYKDPLYLASLNMSGSGKSSGQLPEGMVPTYEADESGKPQVSGYKKRKDTLSRNGALVKAFKNL